MKKSWVVVLILLFAGSTVKAQDNLVRTSVCFDLLATVTDAEKWIGNDFFKELSSDAAFVDMAEVVNLRFTSFDLIDLYSRSGRSTDDLYECVEFFRLFTTDSLPRMEGTGSVQRYAPHIYTVLRTMTAMGYADFWRDTVAHRIYNAIEGFRLDPVLPEAVQREIASLAGNSPLEEGFAPIYVLDIKDAFILSDGTFCSSTSLLNPQANRNPRISFVQVYIRDNLDRLFFSPELRIQLDELYATDAFYAVQEDNAARFGRRRTDAFLLAAEAFISRRLGLRSDEEVYTGFSDRYGGSLVLAPVIYRELSRKPASLSYNDFLLQLFQEGMIRSGRIRSVYDQAMHYTSPF